MKLVKSLLLGSAAGIVAVGSAVAADLPVRKAAPVDYVQVCSQFGTGYFFIPGTDTCLRVSGLLRYEMRYDETGTTFGQTGANVTGTMGRTNDQITQFMRADLNVSTMTATEFGTLETFARLRADGGAVGSHVAYIDFAGLRVGRFASAFSFGDNPALRSFVFYPSSGPQLQAAYTIDAGAFSATIALEQARRLNTTHSAGGALTFAGAAPNNLNRNASGTMDFTYGGRVMPDIVGSLNYSDGGISAQLAGVLHELREATVIGAGPAAGTIPSTAYGFAVMGGVNVQLGTISPGTSMRLVAGYSEGAVHHLGLAQAGNTFSLPVANAFVNNVTGNIQRTSAWAINASVSHAWTPTVTQNVFGGYNEYTTPGAARITYNAGSPIINGPAEAQNWSAWRLGTNLQWTPVSGLTFGAEVMYTQTDASNRVLTGLNANGNAVTTSTDEAWAATLRVQRTF